MQRLRQTFLWAAHCVLWFASFSGLSASVVEASESRNPVSTASDARCKLCVAPQAPSQLRDYFLTRQFGIGRQWFVFLFSRHGIPHGALDAASHDDLPASVVACVDKNGTRRSFVCTEGSNDFEIANLFALSSESVGIVLVSSQTSQEQAFEWNLRSNELRQIGPWAQVDDVAEAADLSRVCLSWCSNTGTATIPAGEASPFIDVQLGSACSAFRLRSTRRYGDEWFWNFAGKLAEPVWSAAGAGGSIISFTGHRRISSEQLDIPEIPYVGRTRTTVELLDTSILSCIRPVQSGWRCSQSKLLDIVSPEIGEPVKCVFPIRDGLDHKAGCLIGCCTKSSLIIVRCANDTFAINGRVSKKDLGITDWSEIRSDPVCSANWKSCVIATRESLFLIVKEQDYSVREIGGALAADAGTTSVIGVTDTLDVYFIRNGTIYRNETRGNIANSSSVAIASLF